MFGKKKVLDWIISFAETLTTCKYAFSAFIEYMFHYIFSNTADHSHWCVTDDDFDYDLMETYFVPILYFTGWFN